MPLIGHEKALHFFSHAIENGHLSHAYCLIGPSHIGKRRLAEEIAEKLLHTPREKLWTHPDFILVERLRDEKTEKRKKDITIEQITDMRALLSRSAFLGGYRIVLIDHANNLNTASANALLKILEEPKEKTVFFLTIEDEKDIPETILSRCQTVVLSPVEEEAIQAGLQSTGVPDGRSADMARHAHGLPGLAVSWVEDPGIYEAYQTTIQQFRSLFGKAFHEKIHAIENIFGDTTDHIETRGILHDILGTWELTLRDMLRQEQNQDRNRLIRTYESIRFAKENLPLNVHPRMLFEQILLTIP